jgi:hypothetical protein
MAHARDKHFPFSMSPVRNKRPYSVPAETRKRRNDKVETTHRLKWTLKYIILTHFAYPIPLTSYHGTILNITTTQIKLHRSHNVNASPVLNTGLHISASLHQLRAPKFELYKQTTKCVLILKFHHEINIVFWVFALCAK